MSASYRIEISEDYKCAKITRKDDDTRKITLFDCKLGDPIQIENLKEFRRTHGNQLEKGIYAGLQGTGKPEPTYWLPIIEKSERISDAPFKMGQCIVYMD